MREIVRKTMNDISADCFGVDIEDWDSGENHEFSSALKFNLSETENREAASQFKDFLVEVMSERYEVSSTLSLFDYEIQVIKEYLGEHMTQWMAEYHPSYISDRQEFLQADEVARMGELA